MVAFILLLYECQDISRENDLTGKGEKRRERDVGRNTRHGRGNI